MHQNRRWLARGLKISNNKGLTVRQYQPFFSADHRFEVRQVGRSPAAFYDPLGRPICTLHPNGTYEKVRFGSWSQESWDPNDTVLLRPEADPDVADLVNGYLAAYEPGRVTWFDARIPDRANPPAAAVRTLDQQAAIDAAAHAATPMLAELDALGRVFLMQKSDGARLMATRTVLDFEGARLEIADGGGRTLFTNSYDMAKRLIVDQSQDSGQRTIFIDMASHPVFVWDAEGRRSRMVHDPASRRAETWVDSPAGERLVERTVFGEAITNPALRKNHRGRAWMTWDGAGQSIVDSYDFKGRPTRVRRRLLKDPTIEAAWNPAGSAGFDQAHADAMLEPASEARVTTSEFDALGRPLTRTLPDGSTARCTYGVVQLVGVSLATAHGTAASVDGFEHDARGLRTRMRYGAEAEVTFAYDADMNRLVAMRATRAVTSTPEHLCDITYTYDAVGNVTHLRDAGADAPVFANQTVSRDCTYRYDALYRLCEATGREHGSAGSDRPPDDRDLPRQSLPHVNNLNALRRYVETYEYDLAGNLTRVVHDAPGATPANRWTRQYQYPATAWMAPPCPATRLAPTQRPICTTGPGK